MGDVWEADDTVLSRSVAVKVLRPGTDEEEVFARRFRSEALYTANLCHPNIATVFDYGEDDNLAYLVMELVPGEPLSALVQREGALEPERVRAIMGQAALALGAAHEAGVVHRDVKPANILVMPDGTVKLTDFGIARAVDGSGHTQTGEVLGTPHYLSPEQALGEAATGASDLYALGVVAHELLTGRRPFDKGTPGGDRPGAGQRPAAAAAPARAAGPALAHRAVPGARRPPTARRPRASSVSGSGVPEGDLPEATEDAADVVGTAAAAEESVDDRPAAPPRWNGAERPDPHADERAGRAEGARALGLGARLQRRAARGRGALVLARPLRSRPPAQPVAVDSDSHRGSTTAMANTSPSDLDRRWPPRLVVDAAAEATRPHGHVAHRPYAVSVLGGCGRHKAREREFIFRWPSFHLASCRGAPRLGVRAPAGRRRRPRRPPTGAVVRGRRARRGAGRSRGPGR